MLISNLSTETTSTISMSRTAEAAWYGVDRTWGAPTDSRDPAAGYVIYRVVTGGSPRELLNSWVNSSTAYPDSTAVSSTHLLLTNRASMPKATKVGGC